MVSFQKLSRPRIVTSAAIAIGVVLIYFGFSLAQTGDEGSNLPSAIERCHLLMMIVCCDRVKS
jgi:hypothetical protein